VIEQGSVDAAFAVLRGLPSVAAPPCPDQGVLEAILAAAGTPEPEPAPV
jgi:hypothetical protein